MSFALDASFGFFLFGFESNVDVDDADDEDDDADELIELEFGLFI